MPSQNRATFPQITSGDIAAWVQAIASVAAIFGAVWITNRDRQETRRLANRDRISAIGAIMDDVREQISSAREATLGEPVNWANFQLRYDRTRFQRSVDTLAAAPISDLNAWDLTGSAIDLRELGMEVLAFLDQATMVYSVGPPPNEILGQFAARADECMSSVEIAIGLEPRQ